VVLNNLHRAREVPESDAAETSLCHSSGLGSRRKRCVRHDQIEQDIRSPSGCTS
jgi:hypothetical protein